MVKRKLRLRVEGFDQIPAHGPVIIASRHFHHLYDGCVLMATLPRPSHILVAVDWTRNPIGRGLLERACKAAGWPIVLRPSGPSRITQRDAAVAFRLAAAHSLDLFRAGHNLIVFPEGYPNIDPGFTPKADETTFLPFQRGMVRLATMAQHEGMTVPIVPAGLSYSRTDLWDVVLRFGPPLIVTGRRDEDVALRQLEHQVRLLSR